MGKVVPIDELQDLLSDARRLGRVIVFTNGCFDVLHRGHVEYLQKARAIGDVLVVGLNSDASVALLKGPQCPLVGEDDRATVLAALACVDYVTIFDDLTPGTLIRSVRPDVLVKGGDWPIERIVGREFVESYGGRVLSLLSSVQEYSTSVLIDTILRRFSQSNVNIPEPVKAKVAESMQGKLGIVMRALQDSIRVKQNFSPELIQGILDAGDWLCKALKNGNKILLCGNGGSAADAQHLAAEFVGRFSKEYNRRGLPAIALTTDTSTLTAIANDFGFEEMFARQIEALGRSGDVLIAISTSGNSPNVLRAIRVAQRLGLRTVLLTGATASESNHQADLTLRIPAMDTSRIQESHILVEHILCELVERSIRGDM